MDKLNADYIFEILLPKLINENVEMAKKINAVINFTLTGDSQKTWTIDLQNKLGVREGMESGAKCSASIDRDLFEELLVKKKIKSWLDAYKSKQIQTTGHLPTIIKIERLFGDNNNVL